MYLYAYFPSATWNPNEEAKIELRLREEETERRLQLWEQRLAENLLMDEAWKQRLLCSSPLLSALFTNNNKNQVGQQQMHHSRILRSNFIHFTWDFEILYTKCIKFKIPDLNFSQ